MASYTGKPLEEVFRTFMLNEYYDTLAHVLEQMDKKTNRELTPAFPVTAGGASLKEQQAILAILALAKHCRCCKHGCDH